MDRAEIVKTKSQLLGKLLGFEANFNADTETGDVVHHALMNGLFFIEDLSWMMDLRPLQPSAFHYRTILLKEIAIASHFEQPASR